MSVSAAAMKSVKVFFLFIMRPASCHALPNSPPPRMWAMARVTPRSTSEQTSDLNVSGVIIEPVAQERHLRVCLLDARQHLCVEVLLQRRRGLHHRVGVRGPARKYDSTSGVPLSRSQK